MTNKFLKGIDTATATHQNVILSCQKAPWAIFDPPKNPTKRAKSNFFLQIFLFRAKLRVPKPKTKITSPLVAEKKKTSQ